MFIKERFIIWQVVSDQFSELPEQNVKRHVIGSFLTQNFNVRMTFFLLELIFPATIPFYSINLYVPCIRKFET